MIVFNRNIVFLDEKEVDNDTFNKHIETIPVSEDKALQVSIMLPLKSDWIPLSGQEACYYSTVYFHETDHPFPWALEIKDVITLVWQADKRKIRYIKGENYTAERLRFWVLHTFFPLVLEMERTYRILHVGAVEIDHKPVLFSAFSFGGKSTMTDYFLQQGHPLLSDDSLGIEKREDGYYAIPSYPFHRPYRELETLGYYSENFVTEAKHMHAVYVLDKSGPDSDIEIVELKGIEKFKAFHYSAFINFDFMKQERFVFFTEMAKHVPVYKIIYPHAIEKLPEVYAAIVSHSRSL